MVRVAQPIAVPPGTRKLTWVGETYISWASRSVPALSRTWSRIPPSSVGHIPGAVAVWVARREPYIDASESGAIVSASPAAGTAVTEPGLPGLLLKRIVSPAGSVRTRSGFPSPLRSNAIAEAEFG